VKPTLLLACAMVAGRLAAADAGRRYLALKDNSGLYLGEGMASAEAFGGDGLKALQAAPARSSAPNRRARRT